MKKVAITGNMGSGKTLVSRIFESTGIPVYYADSEAKKLYSDTGILLRIKSLFGSKVFENNSISFHKLAQVVFSDETALRKLESVIHPKVADSFLKWAEQQSDAPYVIMENAVLFEGGFDAHFHRIIFVSCPEEIRIRRIIERDHTTAESVVQRMKHQWKEAQKISRCHDVIINDDDHSLLRQSLHLIEKYNEFFSERTAQH